MSNTAVDATHYNLKYGSGDGWKYNDETVQKMMRPIIRSANWGPHIIEIGCGEGYHSWWLSTKGVAVTAVDSSSVAIQRARQSYQNDGLKYVNADVAEWNPGSLCQGIFARGMSWYHRELDGSGLVDVPAQTARVFGWLEPGTDFALQIWTTFSGDRPRTGIHHNRLSDYLGLFEPLGEVVSACDYSGANLLNGGSRRSNGINIIVRKT